MAYWTNSKFILIVQNKEKCVLYRNEHKNIVCTSKKKKKMTLIENIGYSSKT